MNFLGHEYVKESASRRERGSEEEGEGSSEEEDVSMDRSLILGA